LVSFSVVDSREIKTYFNMEQEHDLQRFIESLSTIEKLALKIAQDMLNISDITDMNAFKEFVKK
jgi:hypothetical protein